MLLIQNIKLRPEETEDALRQKAAKILHCTAEEIVKLSVVKSPWMPGRELPLSIPQRWRSKGKQRFESAAGMPGCLPMLQRPMHRPYPALRRRSRLWWWERGPRAFLPRCCWHWPDKSLFYWRGERQRRSAGRMWHISGRPGNWSSTPTSSLAGAAPVLFPTES